MPKTKNPPIFQHKFAGKVKDREEAEKIFFEYMDKHKGKRAGDPREYLEVVGFNPGKGKLPDSLDYMVVEDTLPKDAVPASPSEKSYEKSYDRPAEPTPSEKLMIPIASIVITKENPRTSMDEAELQGLKASIEAVGQKEPVKVRRLSDGRYELLSGHRRVRVLQELGMPAAWAVLDDIEERRKKLEMGVSNLNREDMNPIDLANWLRGCLEEDRELNQETLGKICGHEQAWVSNHLRLLKAPKDLQDKLISREMTPRHVILILPFVGYPVMKTILASWEDSGWGISVNALEERIEDCFSSWHDEEDGLLDLPNEGGMVEDDDGNDLQFPVSGCKGCERAYEGSVCYDTDCWKAKMKDARAKFDAELEEQERYEDEDVDKTCSARDRANAVSMEKLLQLEIIETKGLPYDSYSGIGWQQFDKTECVKCPKLKPTTQGMLVCIDKTCLSKKTKAYQREKSNDTRKSTIVRIEAVDKFIEEAVTKVGREEPARRICERLMAEYVFSRYSDATTRKHILAPWMEKEEKGSMMYHENMDKVLKRIEKNKDWTRFFLRVLLVPSARNSQYGLGSDNLIKVLGQDPGAELVKGEKKEDSTTKALRKLETKALAKAKELKRSKGDGEETEDDEDAFEDEGEDVGDIAGDEDLVGEEGDGL